MSQPKEIQLDAQIELRCHSSQVRVEIVKSSLDDTRYAKVTLGPVKWLPNGSDKKVADELLATARLFSDAARKLLVELDTDRRRAANQHEAEATANEIGATITLLQQESGAPV